MIRGRGRSSHNAFSLIAADFTLRALTVAALTRLQQRAAVALADGDFVAVEFLEKGDDDPAAGAEGGLELTDG